MVQYMKLLIKLTFAFVFLPCILADCAVGQKVDLSTDEAVSKALAKYSDLKSKLDRLCIERLKGPAAIIVIGTHANDSDCQLEGAFVNSIYLEDSAELSQIALTALGWQKANQKGREEMAKLWVEKGLLAFSTVLNTTDKSFPGDDFQPPGAVSGENGETVIRLWTSVMKRKVEFEHIEYRFAEDGKLLGRWTLNEPPKPDISNSDEECIKRFTESPKIIVKGSFRTDYGCHFDGVFVNSRYFEKDDPALSKIALNALGWEKASQTEREKLAKLWVEKGLLGFAYALYSKDKDLNDGGFVPPKIVSGENGEIKITLWIQMPTGMRNRPKDFQRLEFRFATDGNRL